MWRRECCRFASLCVELRFAGVRSGGCGRGRERQQLRDEGAEIELIDVAGLGGEAAEQNLGARRFRDGGEAADLQAFGGDLARHIGWQVMSRPESCENQKDGWLPPGWERRAH